MTMPSAFLKLAIAAAAPLAIAACGAGGTPKEEEAASVSEEGMSGDALVAEMKKAVRPLPGQYSSTVKLVELDVPGVPKAQVDQMRVMMEGAMAKAQTYCLTKEDSEKGFEEMAKQSREDCEIESFEVDGAKFTGRMSCKDENANGTMTMNGTGSETGSEMQMAMDMNSAGLPGGKMAMKLQVSAKRVGDCEG